MAVTKKIPARLCLGCQQQHPKKELVRIVRSPEGEFSVDLTGKKAGRGAYICNNKECLEKAFNPVPSGMAAVTATRRFSVSASRQISLENTSV